MNQRLWFSIALIAVLFCFWVVLAKPICPDGSAASARRAFRVDLRCQ
jgi:hypothetical protein